jgi:hypothetical protein
MVDSLAKPEVRRHNNFAALLVAPDQTMHYASANCLKISFPNFCVSPKNF